MHAGLHGSLHLAGVQDALLSDNCCRWGSEAVTWSDAFDCFFLRESGGTPNHWLHMPYQQHRHLAVLATSVTEKRTVYRLQKKQQKHKNKIPAMLFTWTDFKCKQSTFPILFCAADRHLHRGQWGFSLQYSGRKADCDTRTLTGSVTFIDTLREQKSHSPHSFIFIIHWFPCGHGGSLLGFV